MKKHAVWQGKNDDDVDIRICRTGETTYVAEIYVHKTRPSNSFLSGVWSVASVTASADIYQQAFIARHTALYGASMMISDALNETGTLLE